MAEGRYGALYVDIGCPLDNNNSDRFLKATRLSRRQEGYAGIGFSINLLFLMLLLSAMTIDH